MNKRVLVTGGAGYIGSHTTVELVAAGYKVVIVDDLSNAEEKIVENIREIAGKEVPFIKADCRDKNIMREVFEEYRFGSVVHFAASKSINESIEKPLHYYSNNLGAFMSVLELMQEYNVPNIIFSSSATVYGQPDVLPPDESAPCKKANSPYGETKKICEDILSNSIAAYTWLRGISLRYFNPIGAHPSGLIGELPQGVPNNLLPYVTQTAAGVLPILNIFGGDYNTPDGSALRDYIDITDLAKAHVAAIRRLTDGENTSDYEIFNIGTGKPVSVLEIVKTFEKVNGVKVPHQITGRRAGDIEALWADASLAEKELGWKAERKLEDTLRDAWNWEKRLRNL